MASKFHVVFSHLVPDEGTPIYNGKVAWGRNTVYNAWDNSTNSTEFSTWWANVSETNYSFPDFSGTQVCDGKGQTLKIQVSADCNVSPSRELLGVMSS